MKRKRLGIGAAALIAMLACALPSQAITIGADAVDRAVNDSYSDFSMLLLNTVVPAGFGDIASWETYVGNAGDMALLFLSPVSGNDYQVEYVDARSVNAGYNSFTASGTLTAGWIMGIWMGDAKVDFDRQTSDTTTWTSNSALASAPSVSDTISYTGATDNRAYSINVTNVPEGGGCATLLLFGVAGMFRYRKHRVV